MDYFIQCIFLYSFIIDGLNYICASCLILAVIPIQSMKASCHSQLQESLFIWSPYVFDVAKRKKMSLTSENGHYK